MEKCYRTRKKEVGLEPYRVDKRTISDSIITEIVSGIGNCRLFFADVTTLAYCGDRAFRNENVLYEVGIAHSSRLPEEVILFRSDNDKLMFDLANIRVNTYDPDGKPEEAKKIVTDALNSAFDEIELQKHFYVQRAIDSLTHDCIQYLLDLGIKDNKFRVFSGFHGSHVVAGVAMRSNSIHHMINLGILSIEYPELDSVTLQNSGDKWKYTLTSFGKVAAKLVAAKYGLKYDFEITDNDN